MCGVGILLLKTENFKVWLFWIHVCVYIYIYRTFTCVVEEARLMHIDLCNNMM